MPYNKIVVKRCYFEIAYDNSHERKISHNAHANMGVPGFKRGYPIVF